MHFLTKFAITASLLATAVSAAAAPVTQSIGPINYDHESYQGWSDDNFGQITLAQGTNQITSITGSSYTYDQGWGGNADCCNAVNLRLFSGTTMLWEDHFAGGKRDDGYNDPNQSYATSADGLAALNGILQGYDWSAGSDLSLQLHGNAWAYPGWALHAHDVQLSVTSDVPEPTSIALLGLGMLGMGALRRKKQA